MGEQECALWAETLVADPYSPEIVASRLSALLHGKPIGKLHGISKRDSPRTILENLVEHADWSFKPEAFDAVWHAVFKVATEFWCIATVREATYFWTVKYLENEALDAISVEEDEEEDDIGLIDGYDKTWIATSVGDARLYALGYGYSAFAWNAFLDGLGLGGEDANSDSMRIGSCGQLLGAGQRLKLRIHGGGDWLPTPGLAGRYLQGRPPKTALEKKEREEFWEKVLKALGDQQQQAGSKAAALLQRTLEHLKADAPDMTSVEVANIIWPK